MTVSSRVSSIIYVGDGQTTEFDVPFRFLENSDLQLSIQATDGTVTNLVLNSDYTVTGANSDNGGKVHLTHPAPAQSKLSILRVMDLLQETDYRENERFPAESHERALDKLTMETQQLQAQLDRAVKVDVFSDADPSEIVYEIEELYDIKDSVITAANISSDIVTCSENIEAIQNAPNQATIAATSAQNAEGYASSAHIDAGVAENSATAAQQWATKMDGQVESTEYSSKYYAGQSAASATAAQEALDNVHGLIATPIGTIFQSIYVDESLDIARRLNGQLISSTKFTGFRAWLNDVLAAFPSLFTTETNWQAEKTNSKLGQCGKFVIDDTAGTIRLPCVVNAQGLTDLQYLGTIKSESLPNISGEIGLNTGNRVSGSFSTITRSSSFNLNGISVTNTEGIGFSASRSSSTYQDNAPVQQEAVQYPYYIQVATGVEETLPAIREYNINTPFFFGQSMYSDVAPDNASWLISNGQWNAKSVYPDYYDWLLEQMNAGVSGFVASTAAYTDYDFVINTTDQTFRLPLLNGEEDLRGSVTESVSGTVSGASTTSFTANKNGWLSGKVFNSSEGSFIAFNIGDSEICRTHAVDGSAATIEAFIKTGQTIDVEFGNLLFLIFTPAVGNGTLYYYVGDTVQDASLINAGAVLGQLSNKADIDASNFNADGKSLLSGLGMPSNRYIDLTLGASGSNYTAPANGWVCVGGATSSGYYQVNNSAYRIRLRSGTADGLTSIIFPVRKGQEYVLEYNEITQNFWYVFVYAEGDK